MSLQHGAASTPSTRAAATVVVGAASGKVSSAARVADRPAPSHVLLEGGRPCSSPPLRTAAGSAAVTVRRSPSSSPARQLRNEIVDHRHTQFDLQSRLAAAEREAAFYRQRCARLEDELVLSYTEFVPPVTFLPKPLQERHREVVDALNDYALLYRTTKLQLLYDRCGRVQDAVTGEWAPLGSEALEKQRLRRVLDEQERGQEQAYLKQRVASLTTQVQSLQHKLAGTLSAPMMFSGASYS